eukprot:2084193-Rhodomonas_salina.1
MYQWGRFLQKFREATRSRIRDCRVGSERVRNGVPPGHVPGTDVLEDEFYAGVNSISTTTSSRKPSLAVSDICRSRRFANAGLPCAVPG